MALMLRYATPVVTYVLFSAGAAIAMIGGFTLVGWLAGIPALTTWGVAGMPMAPSAAVLSSAMGTLLMLSAPAKRPVRCIPTITISTSSLAACGALLALRANDHHLLIERLGLGISGMVYGQPMGVISPVASISFAAAALTFLAQCVPALGARARLVVALMVSGAITAVGLATLLTMALGYPMLAGAARIPLAANTCVVLVILGGGLGVIGVRLFDLSTPTEQPPDRSWRPLGITFIVVVWLALTIGYATYRQEEREIRQEARKRLDGISLVRTQDVAQLISAKAPGIEIETRQLPDAAWTLAAVSDGTALRAELWERLRWILSLVSMLVMSAGTLLALLWRNHRASHYRARALLAEAIRSQDLRITELAARSPAVLYTLRVSGSKYLPVEVSPNIERILGYSLAEALDPAWFLSHLFPADRDGALNAIAALDSTDEVVNEFRFVRKDGSVLWVLNQMNVTRREAGRPVEITGAWQDITERRKAETALRESEERLRLALESAAQGLWDLNIQTDEAIVSPEYASMLGYEPSDFRETNTAWRERLHPDDRDAASAAYLDYIAGRRSTYSIEFRQRTKSGEWKWILSVGKILSWTPDGRPLRMLGTHTDINVRKLAELRSDRLAELYEALSTCNFAVAHCTNQDDLFERVSAAAAGIRGVAAAWIGLADPVTHRVIRAAAHGAGPAPNQWVDVSTEDIPIGRGPTGTAIREDRACWLLDLESAPEAAPWRSVARQHGWVAAGSFPLRRDGRAIGALSIYANTLEAFDDDSRRLLLEISTGVSSALDHFARERRRTAGEAALRESETRYRTALQEREALLKEVHHRVKNNLQVISSLLRLERERHGDASVKSAMSDMQQRILSMALLHETLYKSSDLARVDLSAYLTDLAGHVFRASAPSNGSIALQLNLASLRVDIDDAVPCGLVVNEILSNCLKHGFPHGRGGTVSIDLQPVGAGTEYLLRISDTGIGLPDDFETRRSGSLGVQLIRVLAGQLKGSLRIDHSPGTTFSIVFAPGISSVTEATP